MPDSPTERSVPPTDPTGGTRQHDDEKDIDYQPSDDESDDDDTPTHPCKKKHVVRQ